MGGSGGLGVKQHRQLVPTLGTFPAPGGSPHPQFPGQVVLVVGKQAEGDMKGQDRGWQEAPRRELPYPEGWAGALPRARGAAEEEGVALKDPWWRHLERCALSLGLDPRAGPC